MMSEHLAELQVRILSVWNGASMSLDPCWRYSFEDFEAVLNEDMSIQFPVLMQSSDECLRGGTHSYSASADRPNVVRQLYNISCVSSGIALDELWSYFEMSYFAMLRGI